MFFSLLQTPVSRRLADFCCYVKLHTGCPVLGFYTLVVILMGKRKDMIHPRFLGEYIRLLIFN